MVMLAIVLKVESNSILVRDLSNNQEVQVNMRNTQNISVGDRVAIFYNGTMTMSIPPQITALSVQVLKSATVPPATEAPWTEVRAVIVDKRNNSLLVRNINDNSLLVVNTPNARFFCNGQTVIVRYDTIRLSNPPEVDALDILPAC